MSWNETRRKFKEQFADYKVKVVPPCMSPNREGEYIMQAMECAVGEKCSPFVTIDHENKAVIYNR
jgi:hypothetical protein